MARAEVIPVPTLSDNYAYLLIDKKTKTAACVDPAEPEKVIAAAKEHGVTLQKCLCTHRHADHSGGNEQIKTLVPGIEVIGSAYEETPGRTKAVCDGETFRIGDTLFLAGCGRFFEGDATQMHRALMKIIGELPAETLVYCGHEYTVANLQFAASVEPNNPAVQNKLEWAQQQRNAGKPTIPSSIGEEKTYNPFMRVDKPEVQRAVRAPEGDEVQTMHILRERKNTFRG